MGLSKFPKDTQLRSDKPWLEPPSGTQNMMKGILATQQNLLLQQNVGILKIQFNSFLQESLGFLIYSIMSSTNSK